VDAVELTERFLGLVPLVQHRVDLQREHDGIADRLDGPTAPEAPGGLW
jgi:hypothetical protein